MGRARSFLALCLPACALACGSSPEAIATRIGEVHLHRYPSGGIVSTLFVDPPTPIAQTELDSALPNVYTPARTDGSCRLIVIGSCAPRCAPPDPVDGGAVVVDGLAHALELTFDPKSGSYEPIQTDDLGAAAGALVTVRSPGAPHVAAFDGAVALPRRLTAASTLDAGLSRGLEASWTPADPGARILVDLTVVPRTGTGAIVRCDLDDAAGRVRVPDDLLALVPAAPRLVDLEISRYRIVDVPVGDGRSVVLHGSDSVLFGRDEP